MFQQSLEGAPPRRAGAARGLRAEAGGSFFCHRFFCIVFFLHRAASVVRRPSLFSIFPHPEIRGRAPSAHPNRTPMSRPSTTSKRHADESPAACGPGPSGAPASAPPIKRARPSTATPPTWQVVPPAAWLGVAWAPPAGGSPGVPPPLAPPPALERRRSSSAPPPDVRSGSEWGGVGTTPNQPAGLALVPYAPLTDAATIAARLRGEAALHARFAAQPPPPDGEESDGDGGGGGGGGVDDGTPMDE